VEVQGWSDVPRGEPLFETIFVFQNTPADTTGAATARRRDLEIEEGRFQGGSTNYPLSIDVEPDERLQLTVTYDRSRFRDATAEAWAEDLAGLLEALAADPGVRFEDLRARLAAAADERRRRRQKEASSRSLARLARVRRRTVATPDATTSDSNEESQQA
jgi:non-ribosomal peptide synthetase component F